MLADRKMKTIINHSSTVQTLHYCDTVVQLSHTAKELDKDSSCEVRQDSY